MKLNKWKDIADDFTHNLLIGNGASIAVDKRFSYHSLFQEASDSEYLDIRRQNIFKQLETTDFEFILRQLRETSTINEILGVAEKETMRSYRKIRDALISTVRSIHPPIDEVRRYLGSMADYMKRFRTVLSLNYDLLVYWAMLAGNDRFKQWFKDAFVREGGEFETDFGYLYTPHPPAEGATLVFYPHGNLCLASRPFDIELKLSKEEYLLDTILSKWEEGDYIPLFVSEGKSSEKFNAIRRSSYLNTIYHSILSQLDESLVVYGWSMGTQDDHILKAIAKGRLKNIAVSVYTGDEDWRETCHSINTKIIRTRGLKDCKVLFFDAESEGCWIH